MHRRLGKLRQLGRVARNTAHHSLVVEHGLVVVLVVCRVRELALGAGNVGVVVAALVVVVFVAAIAVVVVVAPQALGLALVVVVGLVMMGRLALDRARRLSVGLPLKVQREFATLASVGGRDGLVFSRNSRGSKSTGIGWMSLRRSLGSRSLGSSGHWGVSLMGKRGVCLGLGGARHGGGKNGVL